MSSILLITLALTLSTSVQAGVISGGGGGAFVCRDSSKTVISAELLDFWEAREVSGLTIERTDSFPMEAQFARAAARLGEIHSDVAAQVRKNFAFIMNNRQFVGANVKIATPTDANEKIYDANCPLEGMMFYDDDREKLVIKADVFNAQKSFTDIAGSYFHEALYKAMRAAQLDGGKDSVITRIITGCVFSTASLESCLNLKAFTAPADRKSWKCEIPSGPSEPGLSFTVFKSSEEEEDWIFVPHRLGAIAFGYEMTGLLRKRPVTLPTFEDIPEGTGSFEITDSLRITGLERLGLPWNRTAKPPYGLNTISIVKTNPLTVQHGSSGRSFQCR